MLALRDTAYSQFTHCELNEMINFKRYFSLYIYLSLPTVSNFILSPKIIPTCMFVFTHALTSTKK